MRTHRRLGILTLTALALSACQRAPGGSAPLTDADRNSIHAFVANFDKGVLAADWPAVTSAYTEDGMLLPPNAPVVQGRVAIQKFFGGFPKITAFKQSVVEIEGPGDPTYVRGTYEMTMIPPGAKEPVKDRGKVLEFRPRHSQIGTLADNVIGPG